MGRAFRPQCISAAHHHPTKTGRMLEIPDLLLVIGSREHQDRQSKSRRTGEHSRLRFNTSWCAHQARNKINFAKVQTSFLVSDCVDRLGRCRGYRMNQCQAIKGIGLFVVGVLIRVWSLRVESLGSLDRCHGCRLNLRRSGSPQWTCADPSTQITCWTHVQEFIAIFR